MVEAFGIVVIAVAIVGAIVALFTLAGTGELYRQIGRGAMSIGEEPERPVHGPAPAAAGRGAAQERDEEILQLLQARNARRARRGESQLDIDAELARLTAAPAAAAADDGLRAEVRAHVIARNERRARLGREPLDIEAEVDRQLRQPN